MQQQMLVKAGFRNQKYKYRRSRSLLPGRRWQPEGLTEEEWRNPKIQKTSDASHQSLGFLPHSSSVTASLTAPFTQGSLRRCRASTIRFAAAKTAEHATVNGGGVRIIYICLFCLSMYIISQKSLFEQSCKLLDFL